MVILFEVKLLLFMKFIVNQRLPTQKMIKIDKLILKNTIRTQNMNNSSLLNETSTFPETVQLLPIKKTEFPHDVKTNRSIRVTFNEDHST